MIRRLLIVVVAGAFALSSCARLTGNTGSETISNDETPAGEAPPSPLDPLPNEASLSRGEATIEESNVLLLESYPLQVMLSLKGTMPTPCHHLRAKVEKPDSQNRIMVDVYTLYDPNEICIQMLESFETNLPLGSYPDGSYTVWVNGEQVGEFKQ